MKISFESIPHNVNDKKKREHDVKKFFENHIPKRTRIGYDQKIRKFQTKQSSHT